MLEAMKVFPKGMGSRDSALRLRQPPPDPQVVRNNLSPVWEPFEVSLNSLCSCKETRPLKVLTVPGAGRVGLGTAGWALEAGG